MVLFGFQFYPVFHVGIFVSFGLYTVRSKRVNTWESFNFISGLPAALLQSIFVLCSDFYKDFKHTFKAVN